MKGRLPGIGGSGSGCRHQCSGSCVHFVPDGPSPLPGRTTSPKRSYPITPSESRYLMRELDSSASLTVVRTVDAVREHVQAARDRGGRVALVPTMGAFHDG